MRLSDTNSLISHLFFCRECNRRELPVAASVPVGLRRILSALDGGVACRAAESNPDISRGLKKEAGQERAGANSGARHPAARREEPTKKTNPAADRQQGAGRKQQREHKSGRRTGDAAVAGGGRQPRAADPGCRLEGQGPGEGARAAAPRRRGPGQLVAEPAGALRLHGRRQKQNGRRWSDNGQTGETSRVVPQSETGRPGKLSETSFVRGLRRRGLDRLDSRATRVRCVLLSRGLSVPSGGPSELDEPRDRAKPGALDQPEQRAEGVLRAHRAELHVDAVPGRGEQGGDEKLPGHDRGGVRLSLRAERDRARTNRGFPKARQGRRENPAGRVESALANNEFERNGHGFHLGGRCESCWCPRSSVQEDERLLYVVL